MLAGDCAADRALAQPQLEPALLALAAFSVRGGSKSGSRGNEVRGECCSASHRRADGKEAYTRSLRPHALVA